MTHVLKSNGDSIFFYLPLYDKEENLGKASETRVTESPLVDEFRDLGF